MFNLLDFQSFSVLESYLGVDIEKEFNFHKIPDNKNNYRCAQLPIDLCPIVWKDHGIDKVIRLNWDGEDGKHHENQTPVSISDERDAAINLGIDFYKLSSDDLADQEKINSLLSSGNCLVHCAHGADRTGGAVGGYLFKKKPNSSFSDTEQIWKYSNQYNGWNKMVQSDPDKFDDKCYLGQAKKFGVKDMDHALKLSQSE